MKVSNGQARQGLVAVVAEALDMSEVEAGAVSSVPKLAQEAKAKDTRKRQREERDVWDCSHSSVV